VSARPPRLSPALHSPSQACAQAVLASVPELMREIRLAMRQAAPDGLSVPQFRALLFAQRQPGGGVGDLAAHLGVTLPTASVAVSTLAGRGLLTVLTDPADRRRRVIHLTPSGAAVVDSAWSQTRDGFAARLDALPAGRLNELRMALLTLSASLKPLP
jgi:DNA-binding MarR family transcriptional regulator